MFFFFNLNIIYLMSITHHTKYKQPLGNLDNGKKSNINSNSKHIKYRQNNILHNKYIHYTVWSSVSLKVTTCKWKKKSDAIQFKGKKH